MDLGEHDRVRLRKRFDDDTECRHGALELTTEPRRLRVIPTECGGDIVSRFAPVEDPQRL